MSELPPELSGADDEEWPPPGAKVQAGVWEAESLLERGHYAHAARTLTRVLPLVPAGERGFFLGLRHLAVAGLRQEGGRSDSACRQLAHARRRRGGFPSGHREVEVEALLQDVERRVGQAPGTSAPGRPDDHT